MCLITAHYDPVVRGDDKLILEFNTESLENFNAKKISENIAAMRESADNQRELTTMLTSYRMQARAVGKGKEFDELVSRINKVNPPDELAIRYEYEFEDFAESETPYWDVFDQPTTLLRLQRLEVLASEARELGYKSFKKSYDAFQKNLRKLNVRMDGTSFQNPTNFPGQPMELDAGDWRCDAMGVVRETGNGGTETACIHPIMPVERFKNIDTNEEKIKIAYFNGKYWHYEIISKLNAFDASKVIQLAAKGVSVTTKTARALAEYLCYIEGKNKDIIPETESVGRLGYIGNGRGFSPYVDNIVFDGDANYASIYAAVSEKGDHTAWLKEAVKCRNESLTAHIILAASFASPLIGKIGCQPFFVHLWGVESGTGKTVALMLAASVWGNPEIGRYIQTFNATQVGHEKTAAFLNNIPMCIDELQLSKDSHGHSKFDVYQLAQGVGRTRGNKGGGIDETPSWSLCIITTGESPITSASNGAGAVNRVIDVECKAAEKVIKDGFLTSGCLKQNYGSAGKKFIESMTAEEFESAKLRYQELSKELTSSNSTEKQAMAAALIILADELADRFIFHTNKTLTVADMEGFLKDKADVSAGQRAYNFLCDWVAVNTNRFSITDNTGEFWGKIAEDENKVYIISNVFRKVLTDNGFDEKAVTSWLRSNYLITPDKNGKNTKYTSVGGRYARYVVMHLPHSDDWTADEYDGGLL